MNRRCAAEFIGTFAIVFFGCGSMVTLHGLPFAHLAVNSVFGLIVASMIYTLGHISGAHFNPAVTVSLAAARRFEWQAVPGYVAVQCGGALAASGLLRWLFPTVVNLGATRPSGSDSQSLVFEAVLTFFLMVVILQVSVGAKEKGITAAVAIGATVGLEAMFAGPICGASMNPARSLGPAVFGPGLDSLWIYCLGPVFGALLAVPVHRILQGTRAGSNRGRS
jgi:aquaporin Z